MTRKPSTKITFESGDRPGGGGGLPREGWGSDLASRSRTPGGIRRVCVKDVCAPCAKGLLMVVFKRGLN